MIVEPVSGLADIFWTEDKYQRRQCQSPPGFAPWGAQYQMNYREGGAHSKGEVRDPGLNLYMLVI